MAVWVDISHLESTSADEDKITEYGCHISPDTLNHSSETPVQDPSSYKGHTALESTVSESDQKKARPVDDSEMFTPESSTTVGSSASATQEHNYHNLHNTPQPQHLTLEPTPRINSREGQVNAGHNPDQIEIHGITFRITSPDNNTVTMSSDYEQDTPYPYTNDTEETQDSSPNDASNSYEDFESTRQRVHFPDSSVGNGETDDSQELTIGLGIESSHTPRFYTAEHALTITTEADEKLVFFNVDQKEFDDLLATSQACDDTQSIDEMLDSPEAPDYWVEFEYEEGTQWNAQEDVSADGIVEAPIEEEISALQDDSDPEEDFEPSYDPPLSHFQPLPIGPFAPPPQHLILRSTPLIPTIPRPRSHHHPFPTILHDPTTNAISVTHMIDAHFCCPVFMFMRHIMDIAGTPVPLSRRVYELIGHFDERRRGMRESLKYRRRWRGVRSGLGWDWKGTSQENCEQEQSESEREGEVGESEESSVVEASYRRRSI